MHGYASVLGDPPGIAPEWPLLRMGLVPDFYLFSYRLENCILRRSGIPARLCLKHRTTRLSPRVRVGIGLAQLFHHPVGRIGMWPERVPRE